MYVSGKLQHNQQANIPANNVAPINNNNATARPNDAKPIETQQNTNKPPEIDRGNINHSPVEPNRQVKPLVVVPDKKIERNIPPQAPPIREIKQLPSRNTPQPEPIRKPDIVPQPRREIRQQQPAPQSRPQPQPQRPAPIPEKQPTEKK